MFELSKKAAVGCPQIIQRDKIALKLSMFTNETQQLGGLYSRVDLTELLRGYVVDKLRPALQRDTKRRIDRFFERSRVDCDWSQRNNCLSDLQAKPLQCLGDLRFDWQEEKRIHSIAVTFLIADASDADVPQFHHQRSGSVRLPGVLGQYLPLVYCSCEVFSSSPNPRDFVRYSFEKDGQRVRFYTGALGARAYG